jgi:hypothetical protein
MTGELIVGDIVSLQMSRDRVRWDIKLLKGNESQTSNVVLHRGRETGSRTETTYGYDALSLQG